MVMDIWMPYEIFPLNAKGLPPQVVKFGVMLEFIYTSVNLIESY